LPSQDVQGGDFEAAGCKPDQLVLLIMHTPAHFPSKADLLFVKNNNTTCLVASAVHAQEALEKALRQHIFSKFEYLEDGK